LAAIIRWSPMHFIRRLRADSASAYRIAAARNGLVKHRDVLGKAADRIYEVVSGCFREFGAIDAERPVQQG
jgi:hypothetical protein